MITEQDPLRVAVVGVWHVHAGEYVDEMLENPRFKVVGVYDDEAEAAKQFADERGLSIFESLPEALGNDIDGIVVNTATTDHIRIINQALDAGKHVFTEKVLTNEIKSAKELETKAQDLGLNLFVSLQRLAEPWIYEMMEVINSGEIGKITSSRFRYQHGGIIEGWLPKAFLNPEESQGGSIIDLGAHGYYLSNLFHDSYPEKISSVGSHFVTDSVEDHSVVVLTYPGGVTSVLETSLVAGPFARWCEVYGTKGFAVVDSRDNKVRVHALGNSDGSVWKARENGPQRKTPLARWLDAINSGKSDGDNVMAALRLTAQVEASYDAMKLDTSVATVPPKFP